MVDHNASNIWTYLAPKSLNGLNKMKKWVSVPDDGYTNYYGPIAIHYKHQNDRHSAVYKHAWLKFNVN